jgi:predicted dehydrogenase
VKVSSIFDPDSGSVARAREVFPDLVEHESFEDLLDDPETEWIFIGSLNSLHSTQAVAAIEAGKHVFCEKPLATTLEDCLRIEDAVRKHPDRHFFFGLVLRYSPHYRRIKEILETGAIGRIVSFEFNETLPPHHGGYIHGNWRRHRTLAGSHMLEKCCHDLDLANWLVDSRPVRAASFGGLDVFIPALAGQEKEFDGRDEGGPSVYHVWTDPHGTSPFNDDKDIVDNQVAVIEYQNGVRACFHTNCHALLPERRFSICATRGALRADALAGTLEWRRIGSDEIHREFTGEGGSHAGGDEIMVRALLETITRGTEPLAGVAEGLASARAAFLIDQALDTGQVASE